MNVIIESGFQPVDLINFRPKSIYKGEKLVKGYHVSNVREKIDGSHRQIYGTVLRETPGAHSTRKKENIYMPIVELDQNNGRTVRNTQCNCKAGQLLCKHAAALCIYVNLENTLSKTDAPMLWNRPPEQQLEKYRKGCTIESLFSSAKGNIVENIVFTYQDVANISEAHMQENNSLINILKSEKLCIEEKEVRENLKKRDELSCRELFLELLMLQKENNFSIYRAQQYVYTSNDNWVVSRIIWPEELESFFSKRIKVDEQQWINICFESLDQFKSAVWFEQRSIRITASEKAHKIKTRKENFEKLALQLTKRSEDNISTKAMCYGLELESCARIFFENKYRQKVYATGLIICYEQPFLACSPDGMIFNKGTWELLEIKCPYTCKDSLIVDFQNRESFVKYLMVDENGKITLKRSDKYYTQVQLAMYVTCTKVCNFLVFSRMDYIHLKIVRDEELLSRLIPKIESFYFKYFINLCKKSVAKDN